MGCTRIMKSNSWTQYMTPYSVQENWNPGFSFKKEINLLIQRNQQRAMDSLHYFLECTFLKAFLSCYDLVVTGKVDRKGWRKSITFPLSTALRKRTISVQLALAHQSTHAWCLEAWTHTCHPWALQLHLLLGCICLHFWLLITAWTGVLVHQSPIASVTNSGALFGEKQGHSCVRHVKLSSAPKFSNVDFCYIHV